VRQTRSESVRSGSTEALVPRTGSSGPPDARLRIALDCRFQKGGGPNLATRYLAETILRIDRGNDYLVIQHEGPRIGSDSGARTLTVPTRKRWAEFLWVQFVLPGILKRESIDLYHGLKHPGPIWSPVRTILACHAVSQFLPGMQKLTAVDRVYWRVIAAMAWRRAARTLAVSTVCKDTLVSAAGVPADRIEVIFHGVEETFQPIEEAPRVDDRLAALGIRRPYALCVGNPYPHKNYETAVRALHAYRGGSDRPALERLVIAGDTSYATPDLRRTIDELGMADRVQFTGFVDHDNLVYLYNGAAMLLFCSRYEGFGIPLLEAMACGTPVLAAARGAVPEVTGGHAILIDDPMDHEGFAQGMISIMTDPARRASAVQGGLRWASRYRWDRTAQAVLEVYRRVGSEPPR
jgi:glycosyltransferase involved in cell wall biosynthesis